MEINFIITCFDKEDYWPHAKEVIQSYKNIKANIILCYNGTSESFSKESQVVLPNYGHQLGEISLIINGSKFAKENFKSKKFIKLGIDSWLLDEDVIISTFEDMSKNEVCFSGNFWNTENQLSTDIFFVDEEHGQLFDNFGLKKEEIELVKNGLIIAENVMHRAVKNCGAKNQMLLIEERHPVHPDNRHECMKLGWTMHHDLTLNLKNKKAFKKIKHE